MEATLNSIVNSSDFRFCNVLHTWTILAIPTYRFIATNLLRFGILIRDCYVEMRFKKLLKLPHYRYILDVHTCERPMLCH